MGGGGGHEIRLNSKGTVGSFGGQKLIYNKIITRKTNGGEAGPWPPRSTSDFLSSLVHVLFAKNIHFVGIHRYNI